jgi:drug/metabolite transporter (DMT)-like permease
VSAAVDRQNLGRFRYAATLMLTLGIAIFALLVPDEKWAGAAELLAAATVLLLAVLTSRAHPAMRRFAAVVLGVAGLIVAAGSGFGHISAAFAFAAIAALLAGTIVVLLGGLVRLILDRGVVPQAVFGALAIYVLLGLTFAFVIGAIATGGSADYFVSGTDGTQNDRVYFSFTTLTTTGYGDYAPATRGGHALAVLEMLLGQLYLVTVIGLLVGNLRRRRE